MEQTEGSGSNVPNNQEGETECFEPFMIADDDSVFDDSDGSGDMSWTTVQSSGRTGELSWLKAQKPKPRIRTYCAKSGRTASNQSTANMSHDDSYTSTWVATDHSENADTERSMEMAREELLDTSNARRRFSIEQLSAGQNVDNKRSATPFKDWTRKRMESPASKRNRVPHQMASTATKPSRQVTEEKTPPSASAVARKAPSKEKKRPSSRGLLTPLSSTHMFGEDVADTIPDHFPDDFSCIVKSPGDKRSVNKSTMSFKMSSIDATKSVSQPHLHKHDSDDSHPAPKTKRSLTPFNRDKLKIIPFKTMSLNPKQMSEKSVKMPKVCEKPSKSAKRQNVSQASVHVMNSLFSPQGPTTSKTSPSKSTKRQNVSQASVMKSLFTPQGPKTSKTSTHETVKKTKSSDSLVTKISRHKQIVNLSDDTSTLQDITDSSKSQEISNVLKSQQSSNVSKSQEISNVSKSQESSKVLKSKEQLNKHVSKSHAITVAKIISERQKILPLTKSKFSQCEDEHPRNPENISTTPVKSPEIHTASPCKRQKLSKVPASFHTEPEDPLPNYHHKTQQNVPNNKEMSDKILSKQPNGQKTTTSKWHVPSTDIEMVKEFDSEENENDCNGCDSSKKATLQKIDKGKNKSNKNTTEIEVENNSITSPHQESSMNKEPVIPNSTSFTRKTKSSIPRYTYRAHDNKSAISQTDGSTCKSKPSVPGYMDSNKSTITSNNSTIRRSKGHSNLNCDTNFGFDQIEPASSENAPSIRMYESQSQVNVSGRDTSNSRHPKTKISMPTDSGVQGWVREAHEGSSMVATKGMLCSSRLSTEESAMPTFNAELSPVAEPSSDSQLGLRDASHFVRSSEIFWGSSAGGMVPTIRKKRPDKHSSQQNPPPSRNEIQEDNHIDYHDSGADSDINLGDLQNQMLMEQRKHQARRDSEKERAHSEYIVNLVKSFQNIAMQRRGKNLTEEERKIYTTIEKVPLAPKSSLQELNPGPHAPKFDACCDALTRVVCSLLSTSCQCPIEKLFLEAESRRRAQRKHATQNTNSHSEII